MNDLITLEEVKLHCRIDDDYEDSLLEAYIAAALEVCQKHIGKRFDSEPPEQAFNAALKVGCMMYVSQLYEYRATISDVEAKEVPFAISSLWSAYRDPGMY
ncbi:phage gp6-like head-tail connector protein [Pantoea sp. Acro-805]|uniref:Phage gp6-like head-tail connector protein n=1 Tax=Candidatus Pantoea formicae TaxID=2608355 RepID=A0ABX0R2B5_9GAMM|nr:head-tail connector protein [Pantoea formicae]NIF02108.1 phage gp6-like head-tail connector protein [Pantoea formicae]